MITIAPIDRRLALFSMWSVLGAFAGALILTGVANGIPLAATAGSALLVIGYFLHVLVNWAAGFRHREAFVSFRWFWALVGAFLILGNVLWLFG